MSSSETAYVLVLDSRSLACAHAQATLRASGFRVSFAESAETLVQSFRREPAQIVLLELALGQHELVSSLCRQLHELPAGNATAIVWVSATSAPIPERRAFSSGADDSWVWPRSRAELLWRVRALLRLKREATGPDADGSELWRVQRDELLELQRRREETLTLLVHDMKNPLSGVISNAEFLCTGPELDAEQLASAQDIVQASRRLHRMVLSLLDVSLSDLGQLTLEPRPLDLRELVSETRATCSGRLRDKGVELVTIAPNAPPRVQGDRDMLLRLMANLVDNAIGASPAGAAIELAVVASPTDIDVHVSDSGPSLPPAELALMLDELSSSNVNEPKARARRGLGLRACRVITELHGGRIWVEDRQPQGARVCVRLPRSV